MAKRGVKIWYDQEGDFRRLYERGTLSLGQAAELAGYSKRAFIELLGKYSVPVFNQAAEELAEEIED